MHQFPEFKPKQRSKFITELRKEFDKKYHSISGHLEFFEGKINEISYGRIIFIRIKTNIVAVRTEFKSQYQKSNLTVSELKHEIDLDS